MVKEIVMPKGGAGRGWRPTRSRGKDAPRCACGDGLTAIRAIATVPLCRRHAGACHTALGEHPATADVRGWVEAQTKQEEPAAAEA
jgi:hypothetical protein